VPALEPYLIEPMIWQQLGGPAARKAHRPSARMPPSPNLSDRVLLERLVQVLVFGCAYEKIADRSCSATTLRRRRREEWIVAGVLDALRERALEAY
jgi:hypothetical protein